MYNFTLNNYIFYTNVSNTTIPWVIPLTQSASCFDGVLQSCKLCLIAISKGRSCLICLILANWPTPLTMPDAVAPTASANFDSIWGMFNAWTACLDAKTPPKRPPVLNSAEDMPLFQFLKVNGTLASGCNCFCM